MTRLAWAVPLAAMPLSGALSAPADAATIEVPLKNPSFEEEPGANGVPPGWRLYISPGGKPPDLALRVAESAMHGERALRIDDNDPGREIGVQQTVSVKPNTWYEASASVRAAPGCTTEGGHFMLAFGPTYKLFRAYLGKEDDKGFSRVSFKAKSPADAETANVILYTHALPTPNFIVDDVKLVEGVEPPPPPPPPPPKPTPPVYAKVKDLHLDTHLVADGKPNAAIVAPARAPFSALATRVQTVIEERTGVVLPIVADTSPEAAIPLCANLILLGNRSTNHAIEELYNFHYTLLDLRYPGPGGAVVRTLHNPFADGRNAVFVGASDDEGMAAATKLFEAVVKRAPAGKGAFALGRLAEIRLGRGIEVPSDVRELRIWEASRGYGDTGYFGWNSISKHMAAYYMTGEEYHAREFIRLAFPDAEAKKQIADIDGERIENKDEPLSGPYHYNAHLLVLYWDLIEESPVFSDAERLLVTNALSKQLTHHKGDRAFGVKAPPSVGSRHGQWTAISLYCLGRYFQNYYPDPVWEHCREEGRLHFGSLHQYVWVVGEFDCLPWYPTGIAPIFAYLALTGDREPIENGVVDKLLSGLDILSDGGNPDGALGSASIGFLHKAAYLCQDGRCLYWRDRAGVDTTVFRLGQSFWPEPGLEPRPLTDLAGKWSVLGLSKPAWRSRRPGFSHEATFRFASYRSAPDQTGDLVFLKGINRQLRNPYHNFAVLKLRLAGHDLLDGYGTQITTRADGMVEPAIAMNGALRECDVVGATTHAVGEVPDLAYCSLRRHLALRRERYVLIVDDLTFRSDSDNIEAQFGWERAASVGHAVPGNGVMAMATGSDPVSTGDGWLEVRALAAACTTNMDAAQDVVRLSSHDTLLLRCRKPGQWLELPFRVGGDVTGDLFVDVLKYADRGTVRVLLDGKIIGTERYDLFAAGAERERLAVGTHTLAAGDHRLRLETVAVNDTLGKGYIALIGLRLESEALKPDPQSQRQGIDLCCADAIPTVSDGRIVCMTWRGPATTDEHRVFFTCIARNTGPAVGEPVCARLAANAAALAVPQAAVAVRGTFRQLSGELVVLAEDHLFGAGCRKAGGAGSLFTADEPVSVDWDFASGAAVLVADEAVTVTLAVAPGDVRLDGQLLARSATAPKTVTAALAAGRHEFENVRLPADVQTALHAYLKTALGEGRTLRQRLPQSTASQGLQLTDAPPLRELFAAAVGGPVTALITAPRGDGRMICAAERNAVHVLSADGEPVHDLAADGKVRMLNWWREHDLLLAGCADEQVIAFGPDGERKWVFVSEMDPAVFRAAKTYWFKSAPGHGGVHGVYTGVFKDGKSQAFVGSACTLEIIDENGKLIKRMPQFWGKVSHFAIVDGPEGSLNLLAARKYAGGGAMRIINNRRLTPGAQGFLSVPKGHTYMRGWANMSRRHILYADLDGDGVKEVIQDMNGAWNRVTVYTAAGEPLYDASFGPGKRIPYRNMRGLDVADLDGDGKLEIITATSSGLVVVLDHQCRKIWSQRLASPPALLKAVQPTGAQTAHVVVGCEDGTVVALDGSGECVGAGKVAGYPTCMAALDDSAPEAGIVVATVKGQVVLFDVKH